MEVWARSQPSYKTMFSLCCEQVVSLYNSKSPVNRTSVETICHFVTLAVYKNHTSASVMDFQNLAPVDLAWWIDGFMTTVITIITIFLNTISIIIFTSSTLRSPTNAILAMISALDVLTCVLRAPLLIYVYLFQGYRQLPSMAWCTEYNYIHNFIPSALHSTAFLLNMGLSVQRWVGVGDIRQLRAICCYKGTLVIAIVSFCMSALIHSLYPITYNITPVVALGKQMLASGKLEEVETCKVSPRYPEKFETLSTSYAWARISALQLLPGVVMCVCNIGLIAISYKTYNYRRRLIGAIGTIMNINRGFEGGEAENKTSRDDKDPREDGTKNVVDEFQFSSHNIDDHQSNNLIQTVVLSSDLVEKHRDDRKDIRDACGVSDFEISSQICDRSKHNDAKENEECCSVGMREEDEDNVELPALCYEERKVTQELDKILDESDRDATHTHKRVSNDRVTGEQTNKLKRGVDEIDPKVTDVLDLNDIEVCNAREDNCVSFSDSDSDTISFESTTKENAMMFENGIYENNLHNGDQLSLPMPDLTEAPQNAMHEGGGINIEFSQPTNGCKHLNYDIDPQFLSEDGTSVIGKRSISCTELCLNNNTIDTTPAKDHQDNVLLSTISPERKGSDISSIISSTIVEDTIISETLSDSNIKTSRDKMKAKSSPKRRRKGEGEGSMAELRPTIMLVLVTSCTLFAELMVTVAIFTNFMNQVVNKDFLEEDTLITFILVSNLITVVSFPINFVFFSGLSRPFRNTLVAYVHFLVRTISRKLRPVKKVLGSV